MGCSRKGKSVLKRLVTTSTVEQFEPYSEWQLGIGVDDLMLVIKRKSVQTAGTAPVFNVKPAIQIALVRPDDPGNWVVISNLGPYTGPGESNTAVINISALTTGNFFFRVGVSYYLSGTTPTSGQADVEVEAVYTQCGSLIGSMTQELQAFNTSTNSFVAITGWVLAMDAQQVCAAYIVSNLVNNFRCRLVYRTADTSTQVTSAWLDIAGGLTYVSANGETTTADQTLSITTAMYVQFGLAFSQSTPGAAPGQATVSTAVAVRRT